MSSSLSGVSAICDCPLPMTSANLVSMPGFPLESNGVAMSTDGTSIDPLKQLFRASFVGGDKGPMVSQVSLSLSLCSFLFRGICPRRAQYGCDLVLSRNVLPFVGNIPGA